MLDNSPDDIEGLPHGAAKDPHPEIPMDSPLRGVNNPYYGTHGDQVVFTTDAGNTLELGDAPATFLRWDTVSEYRKDSFTDRVIFTPAGGLPVAIGSFQWSWGGTVVTTRDKDNPDIYRWDVKAPQKLKFTPFTFSPQLPTWDLPQWQAKQMGSIRLHRNEIDPIVTEGDLPPTPVGDPWVIDDGTVLDPRLPSSGDLPPLPEEFDPWAPIQDPYPVPTPLLPTPTPTPAPPPAQPAPPPPTFSYADPFGLGSED
jgi:hypothetical protein